MAQPEVDMLNPFVSFEWEECCSLPVNMRYPGQAVCLNNKVYYGGGTSDNRDDDTKLYVCDLLAMDTWEILEVPVCDFALTSFQLQLVLVGGYLGEHRTNKLYVLNHDNRVIESLPPMSVKRSCAVALSYNAFLIVAGGIFKDMPVSDIEIFNSLSKQWSSVQPLPEPSLDMKSAVHDGKLYFFGCGVDGTNVYYTALESLVSTSLESQEAMEPIMDLTWNSLSKVLFVGCSVTKFGNRLISIGGEMAPQKPSSAIHVYHQSWIYAGNLPLTLENACVVVLPSGELMVVGGVTEDFSISNRVFRGHTRVLLPRLDVQFSLDSLSRMEVVADVSVLANEEVLTWVRNENPSKRTWRSLLQFLKEHKMAHEVERIEKYFMALTSGLFASSASEGSSRERDTPKDEDLIAQLTESEETICQLVQKNVALTYDIQKLKHKNRRLTVEVETLNRHLVKRTGGEIQISGVEMCDETKVVVTNSQQFYWEDYGLKLCFPDECLPVDVDRCTITITVSLGGQYQFPEESHLVSPVFWLRSEPSSKFSKPILVEIQHCAMKENIAKLSFVRALCNQKQLPYTFKKLETGGAVFSDNTSFGVIKLNRFSGLAVVQNGCDEREYCANLYYLDRKHSSVHIDFVVTWNTAAHRNVAQDHYSSKQAIQGPHCPVEFDADEISLDIPWPDGVVVNECWKVQPLMRPVVTRKQVDRFQSGKLIPKCQLKAKVISQTQSTKDLSLPVKLIGAKHPYDVFMIDVDFREFTSIASSSHDKGSIEAVKPTIQVLLKELLSKVADKWETIGLMLGIEDGKVSTIKSNHPNDTQGCFRDMLRTWLTNIDPPPSWSAIIDIIETIGDSQLAMTLRQQYC